MQLQIRASSHFLGLTLRKRFASTQVNLNRGNLTYSSSTSVSRYYGPPIIDANRTSVYTVTRTAGGIFGVAKWNYIGAAPQFESYCAFPSTIQNIELVLDDSGLYFISITNSPTPILWTSVFKLSDRRICSKNTCVLFV